MSPSKYPPKLVKQKNPPLNHPSKYKSLGGLYLEIALKYKVKQSKNSPSNYKASPIDFETQISLHRQAPPNISPSKDKPLKKGLWKI